MVSELSQNLMANLTDNDFVYDAVLTLQVVGTGMEFNGGNAPSPYLSLTDGSHYILAQLNEMAATRVRQYGKDLLFSVISIHNWDIVQTETSHTIVIYGFSLKHHRKHLLGSNTMRRQ